MKNYYGMCNVNFEQDSFEIFPKRILFKMHVVILFLRAYGLFFSKEFRIKKIYKIS